jgi:hypothetical protein
MGERAEESVRAAAFPCPSKGETYEDSIFVRRLDSKHTQKEASSLKQVVKPSAKEPQPNKGDQR